MATRTIPNNKLLLDVGGTFIKRSDLRSVPVDSDGSREAIVAAFKEALGPLDGIDKVALAMPGPFDYEKGIFLMRHKFASVYGESFARLVDAPARVTFRFTHDVNSMLLGEITDGAGKDYSNVALVSLGTGLGFALCTDRTIRKNATGSPAVSIFSRPYRDGVLEDFVSKRGILRLYSEISGNGPGSMTVKHLAELAHSGDPDAKAAFDRAGHILGENIAPILAEHKVECLLFGGQISRSFDLLGGAVEEELSGLEGLERISPVSDIDNDTFKGLDLI